MPVDPHRLAEARSLAAHRVIAARLEQDPGLLQRARARVAEWLTEGPGARPYAQAWHELLAANLETIRRALVDDSERTRALRQCTPFAGALDPRERWRIWAAVREELDQQ